MGYKIRDYLPLGRIGILRNHSFNIIVDERFRLSLRNIRTRIFARTRSFDYRGKRHKFLASSLAPESI